MPEALKNSANMNLEKLLAKKRDRIVEKWIDSVQESYPSETVEFFRHQRNRFANPVGASISETIGPLFDELLNGNNPQNISSFLDKIVRIRAVQDFPPSGAVAVVLLLKKVIRDEMRKDIDKDGFFEDLLEFESRIDYCILLAFDVYMKCREKIWEIKLDEFKKRPFFIEGEARCLSYMLRQEQEQGQGKVTKDCCDSCGLGEVR